MVLIMVLAIVGIALLWLDYGYHEGYAKGMKNMSAILAETACDVDLNGDGHVSKAYVSDEETYYIHCEDGFIYAERK